MKHDPHALDAPSSVPRSAIADSAQGLEVDEVMARAGVSERLMRHCEAHGLLPATQRADMAGHRYSHEDVYVLRFVRRAHVLGFGMDEVATLLALWHDPRRPSAEVKRIALAQAEALDSRIEELLATRRVLERLTQRCQGDHQPACPILDELVELRGFASQTGGEGGTAAE